MRHSLYFRNFLTTALIVLVSFTILGVLYTAFNFRMAVMYNRDAMASTLREMSSYLTSQHLDFEMNLRDPITSIRLAMISEITGFDLIITDIHGEIVACSCRTCSHTGMRLSEYDIYSVLNNSPDPSVTTLGEIYPEHRQVAATPLLMSANGDSYAFGYIFVSTDVTTLRQEWWNFTGVFTILSLSVMFLTFAISLQTTRKQAEPLNEMAWAARRFAHGDFSVRVKDTGKIDEISQLTQAFNAMIDSLENSEKLRRDFIANISHELKTPMMIISGFADGILDGTITPEDEKRYLSVISTETKRLARLVDNMMVMTNYQALDSDEILKGSFEINEVIRLALLSLEVKVLEKKLDVNVSLPEEPIFTRGDKDNINQVVYNLVENAIKFSAPASAVSVQLWKQGKKAYVSVENHGETIPADEMPYVFDRFHKADKSRGLNREGVGLGLYLVKMILNRHDEDVYVTSENNVTKFLFTLTIV